MKTEIRTIPHHAQRYPTIGDYFPHGGTNLIFVSELGNKDYEFLVAIHELVEMYLCQKHGIKESDITAFDIAHQDIDPGLSKEAPYHKEHMAALKVEKMIAKELKVDWNKYEKRLEEVCP